MLVCKKVIYQGNVQGVGFRQNARNLARHYVVQGFVRNLPDGTVELVAEGSSDQVTLFLHAVAARMSDCIENQTITDEPEQGFQGFQIRF